MSIIDKMRYQIKQPDNIAVVDKFKKERGLEYLFYSDVRNQILRPESIIKMLENFTEQEDVIENNSRNILKGFSGIHEQNRNIVIKKFGQHGLYDNIRFRLISSRAIRALSIALKLQGLGINIPTPLFAVEKRGRMNKLINSFYVCRRKDFSFKLWDVYEEDFPEELRRKLLIELANSIKKIHDSNIFYGDLHPNNVHFLANTDQDSGYDIYFLDFNRAYQCDKMNIKMRARDLYRLRMSPEIRDIFLKNYDFSSRKELERLIKKYLGRHRGRKSIREKLKGLLSRV